MDEPDYWKNKFWELIEVSSDKIVKLKEENEKLRNQNYIQKQTDKENIQNIQL